jgi:phosphoribosylamine--glycine ligase
MCARILVLGSGGREHALAWRLSRDPDRPEVVVAPGNDGIARSFRCVPVTETDPAAVVALAKYESPTLVVVGPEAPLAAGVSDALRASGFAVSGASRAAARLESSKWFAKELMREAGVPTPAAAEFTELSAALAALDRHGPPWVVKADGLAAGKGVLVTASAAEAQAFVRDCLEGGRFGDGGRRVLFETHLEGEEASVVAVSDGERHVLLPAARDHKRAFDGDRGPNTGGMGAFAPAPAVTAELEHAISDRIITPVLRALHRRGTPYRGALYAGLMLNASGPQVIEFNARFGDPETQSTLPLLEGSLALLLASAERGSLEPLACTRANAAAVTVALVDEGYPDRVRGGGVIRGLDDVERTGVLVFHAGTRREGDGRERDGRESDEWVVRGGRAAYLTATAGTLEAARAKVDAARARLSGHGWRCRSDIAARITRNAHATGVA